ncbi:craniofacial development protein 2-like [Penaeus indicus]|uniref:craniofacial development protein 2-like n=1 Tax=Penaeus indicus TaxID=29960 RepID=UPI00300D573C
MPPGSGPQKHRPKSVEKRGLPHQEQLRPKRRAQKLRIGTMNVGTMTVRGRALTELMRRRKVDIIRWSGNKSKELGDGYKLIYGRANLDKRNDIGIIVSEKLKSAVVETGCTDDEKDEFWTTRQDEFEKVAEDERYVIGGDLNGHVGRGSDVISRVHGGMCYGEGNEDGERVIDFAISNDMVISNTIFTKRQEYLITYRSVGRASQIDYLLYRRRNMVGIINCKVVPGDQWANQHRLVVMDLNIKISRVHSTPKPGPKKIKWHRLKDQEKKEDLNSWWNETAEFVIRAGKEILRETSGKIWKDIETWWFNAEVQRQMKDENGNIIRTQQGNIKRWEQYFSKLLNEENERRIRGDEDANQGAVLEISRQRCNRR